MSRTYEELKAGFERIEAAQACRNLMGKYSYLHTAMRNIDFMNLWANREDDLPHPAGHDPLCPPGGF